MTPTTLECEFGSGQPPRSNCSQCWNCVQQRHDQVEQLPAVADRLMEYRQWILTQVCVETPPPDPKSPHAPCRSSGLGMPVDDPPGNGSGGFGNQWLLKRSPTPASLDGALNGMLNAIERHRLLFLYFAERTASIPAQRRARTEFETRFTKRILAAGTPLLPTSTTRVNSYFAIVLSWRDFKQTAVRHFGSGKGCKPCIPGPEGWAIEVDGGSVPYWSIDEEIANYLRRVGRCDHRGVQAPPVGGPYCSVSGRNYKCP